jgi:hypothetical protein
MRKPVPAQKFNIEEIREKHGWKIPMWGQSLIDLGKCMDDIENRLIREGKLKIVKGRYVKLDPKTGKALK